MIRFNPVVCCVWSVMAPSSKCVISIIITHLEKDPFQEVHGFSRYILRFQ